jgi:type II secretory pathway pseudopilin PulG
MRKSNFTLIELLIVCSILAVIGGTVALGFSGVSISQPGIQEFEKKILNDAFRRFKRDTGYYPKTGAFNYNKLDVVESEIEFDDLSNFNQLLEKPLDRVDNNKWNWNKDTRRGWNGPYLNVTLEQKDDFKRILVPGSSGSIGDYEDAGLSIPSYQYDPVNKTIVNPETNIIIQLP